MKRNFLLVFLISLIGFIFIGRLFNLQILKGETYNSVKNVAVKIEYNYPERGYIYDRKGKLMVANQLSYDVMVIPKDVQSLDTLEFCSLLKIKKESFKKRFKKAENFARWLPSVFLKQLAKEDFAFLQEKLHKYKGFYIQKRSIRNYPEKSAANVVGYISEVNEYTAKNSDEYEQGELIGWWGVEKQYEKTIRGVKGKKYLHRNNLNRIIGSYKNGKYDTIAVPGKDLTLTIDADLQKYGELLMTGKRGGIVAIEPFTGEILALVTAPSYDPNLMVGRKRSLNSTRLFNDTINNPTFDRGLQAQYAPGSPFKMINGLIGLQEGVIDENFSVVCHHGYRYGSRKNAFMKCHCGVWGSPIKLKTAIAKSCNSYFSTTYRRIIDKYKTAPEGMDIWANHAKSFGLGNFLGYDLPQGAPGRIPNGKFYNDNYKFRWGATTTISNAIGQGEVETTPIQLANVAAIIANKGYFYTPHIVKKINRSAIQDSTYTVRKNTTINPQYFNPIIEAMYEVFKTGTGRLSQVKGIEICGKTGTVENSVKIINGVKVQAPDHSIFLAFAPKDNPKIALAIFVENGGYGSSIAAPISSLLIEKYLNGKISDATKHREKNMIEKSLQKEYDKLIPKIDFLETRTK